MTERIMVPGKNKEVELLSLKSGETADQADFPTGGYWYVRFGQQLILKNLSKDRILQHFQMVPPGQPFNPDQDDAGSFSLTNRSTEAEIQRLIKEFENNPKVDLEVYRKQLEQITDSIEIDPKDGSTSLGYSPKPANRQATLELLRQFFPNHQIVESAK